MSWASSSRPNIWSGAQQQLGAKTVRSNDVQSMDFVHDRLTLGKRRCTLTVANTHFRLCPAAAPRFSHWGEAVVQTLERVCGKIGCPRTIWVDHGSDVIPRTLDL